MLNFDHNATHPLSRRAREAWLEATERFVGNPSSPHRLGARADAALTEAREKLAGWLGCEPGDLVWTSGASEATNAVLHHAARSRSGEAWISAIEHPCVVESARRYFPDRQRLMKVSGQGVVEVAAIQDRLAAESPAVIAVMAANNETGVIQPWREVLALARERGVPSFCDAVQWVGKMPLAGLGEADFLTASGHKFGGPQGVGFMKVTRGFQSQITGGPQEEGRRAGTENVAGVLAMVAALEERVAQTGAGSQAERVQWRDRFSQAAVERLPGARVLGEGAERLWNTVSMVMPPAADCRQRWVVKLDKLGFAVSTGSACASGKEQTSHVLAAMDVNPEEASRVLRFSAGWETTAADWDALLGGLERARSELRG